MLWLSSIHHTSVPHVVLPLVHRLAIIDKLHLPHTQEQAVWLSCDVEVTDRQVRRSLVLERRHRETTNPRRVAFCLRRHVILSARGEAILYCVVYAVGTLGT